MTYAWENTSYMQKSAHFAHSADAGPLWTKLSPITNHLESYIGKSLRDSKDAMEEGAFGSSSSNPSRAEWNPDVDVAGKKSAGAVVYTRPPKYGYRIR